MKQVVILLLSIIALASCRDTPYARLVKQELATGKRSDSIFMGMYLGMRSKAFYDHCWKMNKLGLFTNGMSNTTVLYRMDSGLKAPAFMNFFPDFYDDKIFRMKVSLEYQGWAPWNKTLSADSLLPDVLNLLRKWHTGGNDFLAITDPQKPTIYVKQDGNRQIVVGIASEKVVKVDYSDLPVEQKINAAKK